MKPQTITKDDLREKHWWWRRSASADSTNMFFKPGVTQRFSADGELSSGGPSKSRYYMSRELELAAWRYEMARRACGRDRFPAFPELSALYQAVFENRMGNEVPPRPCTFFGPPARIKNENDWTDPHPPVRWCLLASDNSLIGSFIAYINRQRRKHGLPTSEYAPKGKTGKKKSSNRNNKHRPPSWLSVELLDLSAAKLPFEDFSGMLPKAKRRSAELAPKFRATWKEIRSLAKCTPFEVVDHFFR
jgi:hypothetical protein